MDIFDDRTDDLPAGIGGELEALRQAGFSVELTTNSQWMVEAVLKRYGFETKVQWLDDPETSRRFFPAATDEEFGFRLHQADAAVNKALCASRRDRAPRDAVDLVMIVRNYAPLGPLIWALSGKDSELAPPKAIREMRRIAFGYADEEIRAVRMMDGGSLTRAQLRDVLGPALEAAATYCDEIAPMELAGHLFVDRNEMPIEATVRDITNRSATAIGVRDFRSVPTVRS